MAAVARRHLAEQPLPQSDNIRPLRYRFGSDQVVAGARQCVAERRGQYAALQQIPRQQLAGDHHSLTGHRRLQGMGLIAKG